MKILTSINIKHKLKRLLSFVAALLLLAIAAGQPVYAASLSQDDKDAIVGDWPHWTTQTIDTGTLCNSGSQAVQAGSVYVVGDSIGTQFTPGLAAALNASGGGTWSVPATPTPNVKASRNLSGTPPSPDGLGTVTADQAAVKSAKAVIVELGTNSSGFTAANVDTMVKKIKAINSTANIFWINTATVARPPLASTLSNVNKIIKTQSSIDGFSVISWNNAVFGPAADPTQINPAAPDTHQYITTADALNVHLTAAGIAAYTNMIVSALKGSAAGGVGGNGSCSCSGGSSGPLDGADNEEKIWNFLIGKGLTAPQAAGVMGNLQQESGFDPTADQGGPGGVDGAPGNGYGIAQWDSGRRLALEAAAKAQNVPVSDLGFQLNYMYNESLGRQNRDNSAIGEWQGLTQVDANYAGNLGIVIGSAITVPEAAAFYWHWNFERSNDTLSQVIGNRGANADDILAKYGANTGNGTSAGCTSGGSNGDIVSKALLFSWPDKYPQSAALIPKPEYAAALATYNPGAPYNGADCGAFVGTVMHASGADPNYPLSYTPAQEAYVRAHPELYDVVDSTTVSDLQPGDILIVNGSSGGGGADGHTFIYVGPQPPNNYSTASASGGDRMGNLGVPPTLAGGVVGDDRGSYLRARLK